MPGVGTRASAKADIPAALVYYEPNLGQECAMPEPFDEFVDQFMMALTPYSASLTFQRTPPQPPAPGVAAVNQSVGVVRMSLEHLKVMIFLMKKQLEQAEHQMGISIPVSVTVLNNLQIGPEDWESFWRRQ